jgi:hypothetical protein
MARKPVAHWNSKSSGMTITFKVDRFLGEFVEDASITPASKPVKPKTQSRRSGRRKRKK